MKTVAENLIPCARAGHIANYNIDGVLYAYAVGAVWKRQAGGKGRKSDQVAPYGDAVNALRPYPFAGIAGYEIILPRRGAAHRKIGYRPVHPDAVTIRLSLNTTGIGSYEIAVNHRIVCTRCQ